MTIGSPCVSIIIPTYNRAKFLGAAIKSALDQSFEDSEIIVVDDGSTDETRLVIEQYRQRINYIYQTNQGRSNARNRALRLAKGRYIAFLDSDDLYLANKLELQVSFMENHPEFGMIYTSAYCMNDDGVALHDTYNATASGHIYKDIAFFVPITVALPTVMVRREVFETIGHFDENLNRFEDTDMWRRISKQFLIGALPEYTCRLRTHQENALASQDPISIMNSLEYYANKIRKEDVMMGIITRRRGIARLYEYYSAAMMTIPAWKTYGYLLLYKSAFSWPFNYRIISIAIYYARQDLHKFLLKHCTQRQSHN